jgi:hypothetical protein
VPNNRTYEPWKSLPPVAQIKARYYRGCSIYVGSRKIEGVIYASWDKNRIVVVPENGPIYASTNSGMSWTVYTEPGDYIFPTAVNADGIGFAATVTLYSKPKTDFGKDWYMVAEENNGQKLIAAVGESPTPILSIAQVGGTAIISWPASFSGFVLQENSDLSSTNWLDVTNVVDVANGQNEVALPFCGGE